MVTLERAASLGPADLSPGDLAAVLDFWVRAWTPVVPAIDFGARRDWLAGHLAALAAEGALLLLARDGNAPPRGMLTLHPLTGLIDQFAVDPDAGGRGIGRALMAEARRLSPPHGLHLSVNQDNRRAVAFYRAAGFLVTGEGVSARSGLATWTMAWQRDVPPGAPFNP